MKRRLLLIFIASILLFTGCSYIEHTKGADPNSDSIINETLTKDTDSVNKNTSPVPSKTNGVSPTDSSKDIENYEIKDADQDSVTIVKVHIIDVGQGDSILIQSDDHYMLIDAGERHKGELVINYLKSLGVKKLDYIIGTHPHSDHIGGLADVILSFDVDKIIMPNVVHTTKTFEDLLDAISDKSLKITKPIIGNEFSLGTASFVIISPNETDYDNLNNYSVGIKLTHGDNTFIFIGDAEVHSENEMLRNGIDLDADVLKLGHHGSTTSSSDSFLDAVTPDISIISAGEGNKYGHPHVETLQKHLDRDIKLFRTDKQGTIILDSDGKTITTNMIPYIITGVDLQFYKETANSYNDSDSSIINEDTISNDESEDSKNIIVHITRTGSKYHRAGCQHLKSDIEVTLQEALDKGLGPCKTCKPPTA
ncbi:MAG: MBL fold metallo-hydrolase [Anaerolineaceae bacterium]|nr:MAG: MBL fold metallo-hydrolase [Anaerolineaceae bacterium]